MFPKVIRLLESTLRANIEMSKDTTGALTEFTKREYRLMADEIEQAIATLKASGKERDLDYKPLKRVQPLGICISKKCEYLAGVFCSFTEGKCFYDERKNPTEEKSEKAPCDQCLNYDPDRWTVNCNGCRPPEWRHLKIDSGNQRPTNFVWIDIDGV